MNILHQQAINPVNTGGGKVDLQTPTQLYWVATPHPVLFMGVGYLYIIF